MKTAIVTTTIFVPHLLQKYCENARFHGHKNVIFIVIGDKKTPPETSSFCDTIAANYYPCEYFDVERQRAYLEGYPSLWEHIPFNSIQRRNIGLLRAWEIGADVVITIDDDNLVLNQDFIGLHSIVGQWAELPAIESSSGWFNVCSLLEDANGTPFYHRGYPPGERWREAESFYSEASIRRRVAVNAGFWLDDPDIDAITRIVRPIIVRGFRPSAHRRFALQPGTWSPFNSQNTALARDVIPAYFLSPYIGRYDDIWASYVIMRIAEHLGDVVSFGEPLVRQKRNDHNLWRDLDAERIGMILTDEFCRALRTVPLSARSYGECYAEIATKLPTAWQPKEKWSDAMIQARNSFLEGMIVWQGVFSSQAAHASDDATVRR